MRPRLLGLLPLLVGLGLTAPAQAAGLGGAIDGDLVDKTAGASLQAGATAYLYKISADQPSQAGQTSVDAAGHFRFDFLETDPALSYEVGVQYQGAPYFSDKITFAPGETSRQLSLSVYEPSQDDASLTLSSTSLLIDPDDKTHELAVLELDSFVNPLDRTFVPNTTPRNGGPPPLLRFSLPANAGNLQPGEGLSQDDIIQINTGFGALTPLLPGQHELGFTYHVAYETGSLSFTRNVIYPTKSLRVLLPAGAASVSSPQLQPQPDQTSGGKPYHLLLGANLQPGARLDLSFSGLPGVSPLAGLSQPGTLPYLAGVLGLAVLALLAWYVRDRRRLVLAGGPAPDPLERRELELQRRELLISLARLDDRYDAGGLSAEDYRSQRDVQKAELRELMQRIEALPGAEASAPG